MCLCWRMLLRPGDSGPVGKRKKTSSSPEPEKCLVTRCGLRGWDTCRVSMSSMTRIGRARESSHCSLTPESLGDRSAANRRARFAPRNRRSRAPASAARKLPLPPGQGRGEGVSSRSSALTSAAWTMCDSSPLSLIAKRLSLPRFNARSLFHTSAGNSRASGASLGGGSRRAPSSGIAFSALQNRPRRRRPSRSARSLAYALFASPRLAGIERREDD